jgi:hypothetical protein
MEVLEPNACFIEAYRNQCSMRQKVIYLDSPMRPMVFMPTRPGPWAIHTTASCYAQFESYVFDVECQIALYEDMQRDPKRQTEAVWCDASRQIWTLREFLGCCSRDLAAFASAGLDYDSLPADWDCIWNDQMMTWVACEHGEPIGEMGIAAHTPSEQREQRDSKASIGDGVDAVPEPAATNIIGLIAALRRSIAEDDKAEAAAAKAKSAKPAASKAPRKRVS